MLKSTKTNRKLQITFVLICMLVYVGLLACSYFYLWPQFMRHGEPITWSTGASDSAILQRQQEFTLKAHLILFAPGVCMLLFYIVFCMILWLINKLGIAIISAKWLKSFLLNLHFLITTLCLQYIFSISFNTNANTIKDFLIPFFVAVGIIYVIFKNFGKVIRLFKHEEKKRRPYILYLFKIVEFIMQLLCLIFWGEKPLEIVVDYVFGEPKLLHSITDFVFSFLTGSNKNFVLRAGVDWLVFCIPIVSWLFLWILLKFNAPNYVANSWDAKNARFYTLQTTHDKHATIPAD